jgi:hypothetical protein
VALQLHGHSARTPPTGAGTMHAGVYALFRREGGSRVK